jgi:hypothetical protein
LIDAKNIAALFGPGRGEYYSDLPAPQPGERFHWGAYPSDEIAYEELIDWLLILAGMHNPAAPHQPLGWESFVTKRYGDPTRFRHAVIDWTSRSERSPILTGEVPGGWIDPDCLHLGGVSRVRHDTKVALTERPGLVNLERRELSFVTRALPTWIEDRENRNSLYYWLIAPLVRLRGSPDDQLYGWLDLMFAFCAGEPVAYYSSYEPSRFVYDVAEKRNLSLTHTPLQVLPEALLARNQAFRFMSLSLSQWVELERRMAEAGLRREVEVLRAHREGG